jgi:DNA-binding Xre family transcriptional regulator
MEPYAGHIHTKWGHPRKVERWRNAVRWRVKAVARSHGIQSSLQLSVRAGLHKNTSNAIWNGNSLRIDRDTLAKLCHTLQCTPGDLLVSVGTPREEERS